MLDDFGDEGFDYNTKDMFAPFRPDPAGTANDSIDKITISGTPDRRQRIRRMSQKYRHIFNDKLDKLPATLPPSEIDVDKKKWETFKNMGHVRPQSAVREAEINRQVQEMLKAGMIEKSAATYFSQVFTHP